MIGEQFLPLRLCASAVIFFTAEAQRRGEN